MRLRALLEAPSLGLRLLTGEDELERTVRGVMTTDLRDPGRYLSGDELVLTGLAWHRAAEDSEPFVRILAAAGVAGLAAGEAELGLVPDDLVAACERHRLPLFAVTEAVAFATVTEHVLRQVSTERAGDLAAVVDRHRRMISPGPSGGGPDVVLDLLGSDLDLRAWVLSATGRAVAGASGALPPGVRARLAGEHLTAVRTQHRGPHRATADGATYSLFPVRGTGAGAGTGADGGACAGPGPGPGAGAGAGPGLSGKEPGRGPGEAGTLRESAFSDWFLAVEGDAGDWPAERLDLVHGVTQLIAVERERRDAARTVRRRLAMEVLELLQAGAPPAETAARLRVASPVLLPGAGSAPHWQVVVARLDVGGAAHGSGCRSLLEEILLDPRTTGTGTGTVDRVAVAHADGEAVALVPLPSLAADTQTGADEQGGPHGVDDAAGLPPERTPDLDARSLLAAVRAPFEAGLTGDERLTIGVSATVHSAEGLHGALEEARHARRVAAAREGRVCAAGHEELASHVLLLPFVPDDVRRAFTARLLAPLDEYDRRHRAELLPTLSAFLTADGSWTRCAARLHLHVNTLRYRIGRIEQLTGRDLSRLEDKLDFFLALRLS